MNILWFSLSPCGSIRRYGKERIIQGWMISLEDALKKEENVNLSVAFFSSTEKESFEFEGVTYYPMYIGDESNGFNRVINRYRSLNSKDQEMTPIMLDVVKKAKPDIIHIHGTEERFGLIQDYVKNIPIVFSIQGLISSYSVKFFSGIPLSEIKKHESVSEKIRRATIEETYKEFLKKAEREKHYLSHAKYILGRTSWDRNITYGLNPQRQYFVIDEILRAPFYTSRWDKTEFSKNQIHIVSTISGGPYKGYETVLTSAKILKEYSGLNFEWEVIGYDEDTKMSRLCSKITGINHNDVNIKLVGRKNAEEVANILSHSDIFVQVSHIENSPNALCEAMLVGMPIVGTFVGGTSSMLKDGKEGMLVQDGDPYIMAGTISEMANNFNSAKEMADNARKRAIVRHNSNRIVGQLLNAYNTILKESK